MEKLSIRKDNALKAHSEANENGRKLLEDLFGKEVFKFDYRTIVSYEAACKRNGKEPRTDWGDLTKDEIAYIKLKEIVKAINDDPEFPRFTTDEWRYFPWFYLYTQQEIDEMDEETKSRVVFRSYNNASADGGVAFAYTFSGSSSANTYVGSRLAFIESERARFSGNQHKELWADYLFKAE